MKDKKTSEQKPERKEFELPKVPFMTFEKPGDIFRGVFKGTHKVQFSKTESADCFLFEDSEGDNFVAPTNVNLNIKLQALYAAHKEKIEAGGVEVEIEFAGYGEKTSNGTPKEFKVYTF